jgi:type IV secretory pathway TraG/TraD family ATPase VirD4
MEQWLADTKAAGIITAANSRGSDTVLGMIRQKVSAFYFMRDPKPGEETFSFRDWVSSDEDSRWVFLISPEDQRSILAPLITLYFDMIAREIMTLEPNNKLPLEKQRRVWLMLEELPSLPIIPSLEGLTAKGRKYGAVWVLTAQDPGQIEKIYSKELAAAIMQCCNTWLVFRANAAETAKRVSQLIGQYEEMEKRVSHSMGLEANRDGTSVSQQKIVRDAVLPSEIQTLQNLEHYLLIFGPYPRCKQTIPFESAPEVQPGVVLRADVAAGVGTPAAVVAAAASAEKLQATVMTDNAVAVADETLTSNQKTALNAGLVSSSEQSLDLASFFAADEPAENPQEKSEVTEPEPTQPAALEDEAWPDDDESDSPESESKFSRSENQDVKLNSLLDF